MGLTDKSRGNFRITANDKDITAAIVDRFMHLRITDEAGLEADMMELTLADTDPLNPIQKPPRGAELEVFLGYGDQLARMGLFVCDEVELGGWPGYLTIRARAATYEGTPKGKTDLATQKLRSWPSIKLGAMVQKIAKEHGMEAAVAASLVGITLPHLDQTEESDLSFLLRILKKYDAIVKPAGGKLVVAKRGESKSIGGAQLPTITINAQDCAEYRMGESSRENPGTVVAWWHSTNKGKRQEIKVGSGDPVFRVRHAFPSEAAAMQAAQAELDKKKRGLNRVSLSTQGTTDAVAEGQATLAGFHPAVNGTWLISRVEHELGGGGYMTRLEAEKPLAP